jgi:hypothetical protein
VPCFEYLFFKFQFLENGYDLKLTGKFIKKIHVRGGAGAGLCINNWKIIDIDSDDCIIDFDKIFMYLFENEKKFARAEEQQYIENKSLPENIELLESRPKTRTLEIFYLIINHCVINKVGCKCEYCPYPYIPSKNETRPDVPEWHALKIAKRKFKIVGGNCIDVKVETF